MEMLFFDHIDKLGRIVVTIVMIYVLIILFTKVSGKRSIVWSIKKDSQYKLTVLFLKSIFLFKNEFYLMLLLLDSFYLDVR